MKIAIVGAGFLGLSAAFNLTKDNHEVWLIEKDYNPGGLASGYKETGWIWPLEKNYHHFFINDKNAFKLVKEINSEIIIKQPKTAVFIENTIYKFDSPVDALTFPLLNAGERLRMAIALGLLRYNPFWKPLEKIKADEFLSNFMGKKAYDLIWKPQFKNKFGNYFSDISLAWFWARLVKRTSFLAYPRGGFQQLANNIANAIKKKNGKILLNTAVLKIVNSSGSLSLTYLANGKEVIENFDKIIVTLPSFQFVKLTPQLPETYKNSLMNLKGLAATNLILRLKKPFLQDGTYWLSICNNNSPIMAIVEHTNFMNKSFYNNEHLVYLGNYLPQNHPSMKMEAKDLMKLYNPLLRKINPSYEKEVIDYKLFKSPFAQPIIPINYSKIKPTFETPLNNLYLANIQQIYPWDRGVNYAIALGQEVSKLIT